MKSTVCRRRSARASRLAVRPLTVLVPVLAAMLAAGAIAQGVARAIDIPAQPLAQSLAALARQSDTQILFATSLADGLSAPAVRGTLTVEDALARMLAGSRLRVVSNGPRTFTVVQAPADTSAATLPMVTVSASAADLSGYADGVVPLRASGSKTSTPLIDTPQTINVVTREQMDEQGVQSVMQALQYTPGVVNQYGDTDLRYDWLAVRGFVPLRYLDGLRLPYGARGYSQPRIDPYALESVEVLKGPASVLYGQSSPGGLLNLVSKLPQAQASREVVLQTGSHDRAQGAFDFTGPVDEDGKLLYRVVGLARDTNTEIDYIDERRVMVAPSLTWRPSTDTSLTLMAQYQKIRSDGGGAPPALPAAGTLLPNPNGSIPTSRFIGEPGYDKFESEQMMFGYKFEHRANDTWQFRQNARYSYIDTDSRRVQGLAMNPDLRTESRYGWAFPERSGVFSIDNQAEANFRTGPIRHTLLMGVDYQYEDARYEESQLVLVRALDVFNPVYGAPVSRPPLGTRVDQSRHQVGGYLQDSLAIDRWTFLLSGRYDWAGSDTDTLTAQTGNTVSTRQSDNAFTGRAGVSYRFDNGIAPFASFATSFQPQAGTGRTGTPFEPTRGRQTEVGVKYQPNGINAFVTLSAFDLRQTNVLTPDPLNTNFNTQSGEARVRGVELEGKASPMRGLDVVASYAYSNTEVLKANANARGVTIAGNALPFVPEHQASLWTYYQFQQTPLQGLGMGLGVRYIGRSYGDAANVYRVPAATLFDAALSYDLSKSVLQLRGVKVAVNATNLFDRRYVSTCISSTGCYFGSRRTVLGTVSYKF
ncbi:MULTISPECIES: TonB-dependent siderophore receptor [unclassified Cupriavidus]|uniref:TonB-dependent siderophore receptor n=1 Tax=unclassified Cupriavidus TaxID=2640874 RepID=UPI00313F248D